MDIPIDLSIGHPISGMDDFKQTLTVLFKNPALSFLQSNALGLKGSIHEADKTLLHVNIEDTIKQIPTTELINYNIEFVDSVANVAMTVKYKNDIVNFQFIVK